MTDEMKPPAPPSMTDRDNEKLMAAFAYVGILVAIPLFAISKKSPFIQFHVRQGLVLFIVEVVLSLIPVIGWIVILVPIVASLYALLQAMAGRQWEVPFLGKYAKRINL